MAASRRWPTLRYRKNEGSCSGINYPLVVPPQNTRPTPTNRPCIMSAATAEPRSQEDIVRRYQTMTAECDKLVEKITELEFDRNEHKLVEETLQPLDAGRKAYRLVGGVLVERTVGEVLPSVKTNKENVSVDSRVGRW